MKGEGRALTLHIDNRAISLAVYEGRRALAFTDMGTDPRMTADQYAACIRQLLELRRADTDPLEGAVISSVVPPLTPVLQRAVAQLTSGPVRLVGPGVKTGLDIRLDRAAAVGTDFICCCVAALDEFAPPLVVVSLEGAVTFAAVDQSGALVGRSILPGVEDSLHALRQSAAQLPEVSFDPGARLLGKSTAEGMRSGILYGTACTLEGMCRRYREALGGRAVVVATGSLAEPLAALCAEPMQLRPRLLHDGLCLLYHKNMG